MPSVVAMANSFVPAMRTAPWWLALIWNNPGVVSTIAA